MKPYVFLTCVAFALLASTNAAGCNTKTVRKCSLVSFAVFSFADLYSLTQQQNTSLLHLAYVWSSEYVRHFTIERRDEAVQNGAKWQIGTSI